MSQEEKNTAQTQSDAMEELGASASQSQPSREVIEPEAPTESQKAKAQELLAPAAIKSANPDSQSAQGEVQGEVIEDLDAEMAKTYQKYKYSLWDIIACIALYLVCLFMIRNTWLVLLCCVPMIILAFVNNRLAKQYRKLAQQKAEVIRLNKQNNPESEQNGQDVYTGSADSPIVANAKSLNDLPREYTVLDDVPYKEGEIEHLIVSPYGVAIVDSQPLKEQIAEEIAELGIENAPVFQYEPSENIALLAEQIQMPHDAVLSEKEIYNILYKFTGLGNGLQ